MGDGLNGPGIAGEVVGTERREPLGARAVNSAKEVRKPRLSKFFTALISTVLVASSAVGLASTVNPALSALYIAGVGSGSVSLLNLLNDNFKNRNKK